MQFDQNLLLKVVSPKIAKKAIQTFDRATTVVVGACWAAAVLMMAFALYTVSLAVSSKHASEAALIAEPKLPKIKRTNIDAQSLQAMVDRLKRRFPDITFTIQNNQALKVSTLDGSKFRQWLTVVSYIDTISPGLNWSIQDLCVGKCTSNELMRTVLIGERISFESASSDQKTPDQKK
jgi:hypothetical protein